jgi:hypothetical protein
MYYFERALFIVGEPNSGKSTQIRSMFRDRRLGLAGDIPTAKNLRDVFSLSNERRLYLRITSPHEFGESLNEFLDKTEDKIKKHNPHRWNFVSPLQPNAANKMPDAVATVTAFYTKFYPERTRVVFLSPDRHGVCLQESAHIGLVDRLRQIPSVEICWIDARDRTANGLLLADFFDFT